MQPKKAATIRHAMAKIAADPFGNQPNVKHLQGTAAGYRLRVGDWRVLYRVDRQADAIFVERIKTRGEAYKK